MQTLDPLVYWKLKARLLELTVQEHQILAARQQALAAIGLMAGQYILDDNTTSVMRLEDMVRQETLSPPTPPTPAPPAPVPPAPDADVLPPAPCSDGDF